MGIYAAACLHLLSTYICTRSWYSSSKIWLASPPLPSADRVLAKSRAHEDQCSESLEFYRSPRRLPSWVFQDLSRKSIPEGPRHRPAVRRTRPPVNTRAEVSGLGTHGVGDLQRTTSGSCPKRAIIVLVIRPSALTDVRLARAVMCPRGRGGGWAGADNVTSSHAVAMSSRARACLPNQQGEEESAMLSAAICM